MKKDKLITVRISEDLQAQFNNWLKLNRLSGAEFLRGIIENCVNGKIDTDNLNLDYSLDSIDTLDNEQVKKLETRLDELESKMSSLMDRHDRQMEVLKDEINKLVTDRQNRQDIIEYPELDKDRHDHIFKLDTTRRNEPNEYVENLNAIEVHPLADTENLETIDISESEGINEDNSEPMHNENKLESSIADECIKTSEKGNDSLKNDSERGKIKPEVMARIDQIAVGTKLKTKELCDQLGVKTDHLSRDYKTKYSKYFRQEKEGKAKNSPATYTRI